MRKDVALALLGLRDNELNEARINEAYRAAMRLNHPDRYANDETLRKHAEEQCKLINEARTVLLSQTWDADNADSYCDDSRADTSSSHMSDEEDPAQRPRPNGHSKAQRSYCDQPAHSSVAPFLDMWRTSTSASALGVVVFLFTFNIEYILPERYMMAASFLRLAYMIFQTLYALVVYPSLFSLKPKMTKAASASFWNCAVGGFIFGPLWNGNLTKRRKGISNVTFAVIAGIVAASWLVMFGFAAAVLLINA